MDMTWAAQVASTHPDLEDAFISVDEEWLDILLADGRSFRFRPGLMIPESASTEEQRAFLLKLLSIGMTNADAAPCVDESHEEPEARPPMFPADLDPNPEPYEGEDALVSEPLSPDPVDPEDPDSILAHLMPIVRGASYFLASHDHSCDDSYIYVPLTSFLAAGLVVTDGRIATPLRFSESDQVGLAPDIVSLFQRAITHLRSAQLTDGQPSVHVVPHPIAGADVYAFTGPAGYEGAWFMDVDMAMTVAQSVSQTKNDALPLFIPARNDALYLVMADDPALADVFRTLAADDDAAPYPLPHVVSADGWSEWIPLPEDPVAPILSGIRAHKRMTMYAAQVKAMLEWPGEFGTLTPFSVFQRGRSIASHAVWREGDDFGSVPETEFLTFVRRPSPYPWERGRQNTVTLRFAAARDTWPLGITPMPNVWPPRWAVTGFPDEAEFEALIRASEMEF